MDTPWHHRGKLLSSLHQIQKQSHSNLTRTEHCHLLNHDLHHQMPTFFERLKIYNSQCAATQRLGSPSRTLCGDSFQQQQDSSPATRARGVSALLEHPTRQGRVEVRLLLLLLQLLLQTGNRKQPTRARGDLSVIDVWLKVFRGESGTTGTGTVL